MDFVAHPKATYQSRNGLLSPFATWLHGWDSSRHCWDALVTQLPSLYPHCQLSHSPSKTNGTKKCVNIFLQHRKFKGSARFFREPRGIRPFSQPSSEHQRLAFPSAETSPTGGRQEEARGHGAQGAFGGTSAPLAGATNKVVLFAYLGEHWVGLCQPI